ncbi:glycogen operon protein [Catenibacillus scindens]|uniref:Glycogen operon protein n=1 Tax=Catenibacillus scindens TaxID=673271 RepID=A0A7W8M5G7_9FIRM|nr:alpha-amylase family glycosyl hydrolase [Catenibacillus scindens]MBB5265208.1 glycogen operon protein [Catenibacillus scindens]
MAEDRIKLEIIKTGPLPLGAWASEGGVRFGISAAAAGETTRLVIMEKKTGETIADITMDDYRVCGNICAVFVGGIRAEDIFYAYYQGSEIIEDAYGLKLYGDGSWERVQTPKERCFYEPCLEDLSVFAEDVRPQIADQDLVMYKLHVRGFTVHSSSKVRHKGTFAGIGEKADYLKTLGINAVVLMPVVDFPQIQFFTASPAGPGKAEEVKTVLNCWGYGPAQYFAPKSAYAAFDPVREFQEMVVTLHRKGIEVILELLFDEKTPRQTVLDCLRHWVYYYHVDGFWVNSEIVPVNIAFQDPMLAGVRLICRDFDQNMASGESGGRARLMYSDDSFMHTMRCFLKGDDNMLWAFTRYHLHSESACPQVHYMTSNNGFTLADLVSYNEKHNEANGEENRDGTDYNNSWNCGIEGKTRSRKVMILRRRQMLNAMIMLIFQQGVPVIYGGDEFGNSQQGNNNAYCQDNDIFWLNWRDLKKNERFFEFTRRMIALRAAHPILHPQKIFRQTDYLGCGYPDISFHGRHPWRADMDREQRYIGIMYCGAYAGMAQQPDQSFYFAYNMYWEKEDISLPPLPKGQCWRKIVDTFEEEPLLEKGCLVEKTNENIEIGPRSIQIYISEKQPVKAEEAGDEKNTVR